MRPSASVEKAGVNPEGSWLESTRGSPYTWRVGGLAAPNLAFDHFPQKGMTIPRVTPHGHRKTSGPSQNPRRGRPLDRRDTEEDPADAGRLALGHRQGHSPRPPCAARGPPPCGCRSRAPFGPRSGSRGRPPDARPARLRLNVCFSRHGDRVPSESSHHNADRRTRGHRRNYRRNLADMTTFGIDEFWLQAEECGLTPRPVSLVPRNRLDSRYAYYALTKP